MSGSKLDPPATAASSMPRQDSHAVNNIAEAGPKAQPWLAVFPNPKPDASQARRYGFKKGEVIQIAGNAGNFFAHGNWKLECESSAPTDRVE